MECDGESEFFENANFKGLKLAKKGCKNSLNFMYFWWI
jgi:hypothetical protein